MQSRPQRPLPARNRAARLYRRAASTAARVNPVSALIAAATVAAVALAAVATPLAVIVYDVPLVAAFPLVLVLVACLPLAVLRPALAAAGSVATTLVLQGLSSAATEGAWPWWPVLIVTGGLTLLVVSVRGRWQTAVSAWIASSVGAAVLASIMRPDELDPVSVNLVIFASVAGGGVLVGVVLAQWNAIRGQLLRERSISLDEHARRVLAEERARIAREVHDVIAHGLSIINVQSTTARYRHPGIGPEAEAEFAEIAASSRQALGEMRTLLGVLRDDQPGATAPQPGLADIADLVAQARRAGTAVTLRPDEPGDLAGVSDVVALVAYRIVQEALSNAIRHAPGAEVAVTLEREGHDLVVTVHNSASAESPAGGSDGGFGLVGMRERAGSVSGTVTAGGAADGGFTVRAVLPARGGADSVS